MTNAMAGFSAALQVWLSARHAPAKGTLNSRLLNSTVQQLAAGRSLDNVCLADDVDGGVAVVAQREAAGTPPPKATKQTRSFLPSAKACHKADCGDTAGRARRTQPRTTAAQLNELYVLCPLT